jgi:hypothetical protein
LFDNFSYRTTEQLLSKYRNFAAISEKLQGLINKTTNRVLHNSIARTHGKKYRLDIAIGSNLSRCFNSPRLA